MSNQYKRTFITLKQENSGYSLTGDAMGRCIIESRGAQGKISFLAQNLKPEVIYKAYIVTNQDSQSYGVLIGTLSIDYKGRGELKKLFNTYNVEETGLHINDFEVAAILVSNEKELIVPLVGYVNKEISWKGTFKEYSKPNNNIKENVLINSSLDKEIKQVEKIEEELQEIKEEIQEDIKEEIKNIQEEIKEKVEEIQEAVEDIQQEIKEIEEVQEIQKELQAVSLETKEGIIEDQNNDNTQNNNDFIKKAEENVNAKYSDFLENDEEPPIHEVFKAMAKEVNKEITEFKHYTLMTENKNKDLNVNISEINKFEINNELDYMFSNNIKMVPFKKQSKDVQWIRISLKETIHLPIDFYNFTNDPFVVSSFRNYNHLILGLLKENKHKEYLLGLPDIYKEESKIRANSIGFIQFKCCDNIKPADGTHGYWIMAMPIV